MKKMPNIYLRDEEGNITLTPNPDCQWVFDGEGIPTYKWDGTCTMLDEDGKWWARRIVKKGKKAPEGFIEVDYDPITEKSVGWMPAEQSPYWKAHKEALDNPSSDHETYMDGTYELCGPKVNGNRHKFDKHILIAHGMDPMFNEYPDFDILDTGEPTYGYIHEPMTIQEAMEDIMDRGGEGVVWWHPDGRKAKYRIEDMIQQGLTS